MSITRAIPFICIAIFSDTAPAIQTEPSPEKIKELALQKCVLGNYKAISGENPAYQYDVSYYVEGVLLGRDGTNRRSTSLRKFVYNRTKDFHVNDTSMSMKEGSRPYNTIFSKCMDFYRSEELSVFVEGLLD